MFFFFFFGNCCFLVCFCQSVDSVHSSLKELHAAFGLLCKLNCQSVLGFIVEFEHV